MHNITCRVRININILNCKKKWPEGPVKACHRRNNLNLQWKQPTNTINLPYKHDPKNINGIHV